MRNDMVAALLAIFLVSSILTSASLALPVHALPQPVIITNASYGTLGAYNIVKGNLTNTGATTLDLVVFAVWKNSASQTVGVVTGGLTLASGESGTAFAPLASPHLSGTYTVYVFTVTTSNLPDSPTFNFSVTI